MPVRAVDVNGGPARKSARLSAGTRGEVSRPPRNFKPPSMASFGAVASVAEHGAPYGQHYRWMHLPGFPYLLYYEIRDPHPVLIYALAHVSRRPGYWLRRTRP